MIYEQIDLYDYYQMARNGATGGYLTAYARSSITEIRPKLRPAVLVCPGGGYKMLSEREGEPVAISFLEKGYSAFVLSYSLNTPYPAPLREALMAVAYIRENAAKYFVNREKVAVIGFSAGGHLAGLLATAAEEEIKSLQIKCADICRPDAAILSYPVVMMGKFTHLGSCSVITDCGKIPYDLLSVEKRVTKDSVPAFIWHTTEDDCVPLENSLALAEAYRKAGVPFSMMVFEKGRHGLSLCNAETDNRDECDLKLSSVNKWLSFALDWLKDRGFEVITAK